VDPLRLYLTMTLILFASIKMVGVDLPCAASMAASAGRIMRAR